MLTPQKIVVKCPHCSNKLAIQLRSNKMPDALACPVCKQKSPFSAFKILAAPGVAAAAPAAARAASPAHVDAGETDLLGGNRGVAGNQHMSPKCNAGETELAGVNNGAARGMGAAVSGEETLMENGTKIFESGSEPGIMPAPGRLYSLAGNMPGIRLREGRNIIGREASSSSADIRLPRAYDRISREHLIINVKRVGYGYKHEIQLYKREVNATMLNDTTLSGGDIYLLKEGDTIKFPGLALRFDK